MAISGSINTPPAVEVPSAFQETQIKEYTPEYEPVVEEQDPIPESNTRMDFFRSADFAAQYGGFFSILERGPNAFNEFASSATMFDVVTHLNRAAAGFRASGSVLK